MQFIPYSFFAYPYYPHWEAYNPTRLQSPLSLELQSQFPPIDTKRLHSSAEKFQEIMQDARLLIDRIVSTPSFAAELMDAAQLSNKKRVEELIISTGVRVKVETTFNPSGIQIKFNNSELDGGCCKLEIGLLW